MFEFDSLTQYPTLTYWYLVQEKLHALSNFPTFEAVVILDGLELGDLAMAHAIAAVARMAPGSRMILRNPLIPWWAYKVPGVRCLPSSVSYHLPVCFRTASRHTTCTTQHAEHNMHTSTACFQFLIIEQEAPCHLPP